MKLKKILATMALMAALLCALVLPTTADVGSLDVYSDWEMTEYQYGADWGEMEQGEDGFPETLVAQAIENTTPYNLSMSWEVVEGDIEELGIFELWPTTPYTLYSEYHTAGWMYLATYVDAPVGEHLFSVLITGVYFAPTGPHYYYWQIYCSVTVVNECPTLEMKEPYTNQSVNQGEYILLSWDGTDPDDDALVSVGYDDDNTYGGHTWIIVDQMEDYAWFADSTEIPEGTYYIVGVIDDGDCSSYDYAAGTVTITEP